MSQREPNLVSVVIPCYNHAHFLCDAIESVLKQSYTQYEIIVVDDGSTDNTFEVASRYPAVRCVRQENQGLSAARNRGLRESRGNYLVFLDADDRLLPEALDIGLGALAANPDCAFVYGRSQHIAFDGSPLPVLYPPPIEREHYSAFLENNPIWMPAQVMYRYSVFESVSGFNTAISPAADYELYLRIARSFPVHCHNQVVAEYRQHSQNMSRNPQIMLTSTLTAISSQRKHALKDKRHKRAYKKGKKNWQYYYGEELADRMGARWRTKGQKNLAISDALCILRYYPQGFARHLYKKAKMVIMRKLGIRPAAILKQDSNK